MAVMNTTIAAVGLNAVLKLRAILQQSGLAVTMPRQSGRGNTLPDLILHHEANDIGIEVKSTSAGVISHVRPVRYLVLVIYDSSWDRWFVVPAHKIMLMAVAKRGCGGALSYFGCHLHLNRSIVSSYACRQEDLVSTIIQMHAIAARHPVHTVLQKFERESQALKRRFDDDVMEALKAGVKAQAGPVPSFESRPPYRTVPAPPPMDPGNVMALLGYHSPATSGPLSDNWDPYGSESNGERVEPPSTSS